MNTTYYNNSILVIILRGFLVKEHKKLYKAGKLWITATLFALVGVALTTTNAKADNNNQTTNDSQQTLIVNSPNSYNSIDTLVQAKTQTSNNIQDLQDRVNDAQNKVYQAQQNVNDAQDKVNHQQSVVDSAKNNLQAAQDNLQAAGGNQSTVQESISLSSDWINAVRNQLSSNSSTIDVDPNSNFGQELSNYGLPLLSQNQYISDPALQKIIVTLTTDGVLDPSTELEVTRYTISLLNPVREQIGVDQYQITQQALDDSTNIAKQYVADNWTLFNHGSHDFQVLFNNHQDGESLSDGYIHFNYNNQASLDEIHRAIYNSICSMLFGDASSSWGHMTDLAGIRGWANGIYLGVQLDKNGQVHFNGNIVKSEGGSYATQIDNSGQFKWYTGHPDTSARIPLTADNSAETQQLRQAVQDAQSQLDQANFELNNDNRDLDKANSNLQQAQQELQQATDALTAAEQTGWVTENGNKYYRDNNGNLVDGWQKIDGQWYYFNNQILVTNQVMSVPANSEMASGIYDLDSNGHYDTNLFLMGDTNGNWYYFGNDGRALTGLQRVWNNLYYFDPTYAYALTGWQTMNRNKYYFDPYSKAADTGLKSIDGSTYYFDPSTAIAQVGWGYINGEQYYFDPLTFKAVNDLQKIDGNIFYFDNYKLVTNQTLTLPAQNGVTGGTYHFDQNGYGKLLIDGWQKDTSGNWKYQSKGSFITGWQKINGSWYYFDNASKLAVTGWRHIDGQWYYFDPINANAWINWQTINGNLYHFDPTNANALTGWQKDGNDWYYCDPTNTWAVNGLQKINGNIFYFDNHKMVTNQTLTLPAQNGVTGGTYHFDQNGYGKLFINV